VRRFFNKGTNGHWRGILTDDDLALREGARKILAQACRLARRRRRATGEPRETTD
jgi:hypothetical protein